uniref:Immunoglobulin V-set domain-containing protein n=1 Tax=Ursus americanus TaxID=9643 RepID=A0A452QSB4_URSAM
MESPLAPTQRGHLPWQEILLAVSFLTFWNPPTTAQLTVESVPPDAAEGKDVLLRVHNLLPGDLLGCNWFRGETANTSHQILSYVVDTQETTPGPAHSGRETIYPNGSLLFQRVTLKDTGYYTLQTVTKNAQIEHVTGQIRVFQPMAQPFVQANNTTVTEHKDSMVLTCSTNNPGVSNHWFFNGQSLKLVERMVLSQDNSPSPTVPPGFPGFGLGFIPLPFSSYSDGRRTIGLPVWSIIGFAVGVLVGLALTVALGCLLLRTRTGRYDGISHTLILSHS